MIVYYEDPFHASPGRNCDLTSAKAPRANRYFHVGSLRAQLAGALFRVFYSERPLDISQDERIAWIDRSMIGFILLG